MNFIPIKLGIARPENVKRSGASAPNPQSTELTKAQKQEVFERDDYVCRCCGFRSLKFQDVHFLDRDVTNHAPENMMTACTFCHQCFNLQDVHQMRSGALIWMPEIEQYQLNHMARSIYVARISQGGIAEVARKTLDIIMSRQEDAQKRLGLKTSDPYILSMVLEDYLPAKQYANREQRLEGLRLFPLERRIKREKSGMEFNQFPQMLAYWRSKDGPYGGKVPQKWVEIYQAINHGTHKAA